MAPWRPFVEEFVVLKFRKAIRLSGHAAIADYRSTQPQKTVIPVTEARFVNTLTSTSLTSRSKVISEEGITRSVV